MRSFAALATLYGISSVTAFEITNVNHIALK
jgi:hypothetical protein